MLAEREHCPQGETHAFAERKHCPQGENHAFAERKHCPQRENHALAEIVIAFPEIVIAFAERVITFAEMVASRSSSQWRSPDSSTPSSSRVHECRVVSQQLTHAIAIAVSYGAEENCGLRIAHIAPSSARTMPNVQTIVAPVGRS